MNHCIPRFWIVINVLTNHLSTFCWFFPRLREIRCEMQSCIVSLSQTFHKQLSSALTENCSFDRNVSRLVSPQNRKIPHIVFAFKFLKGMACMNLLTLHILPSRYLFPFAVTGRFPTIMSVERSDIGGASNTSGANGALSSVCNGAVI